MFFIENNFRRNLFILIEKMHIFYINSILLIRPNEKICAILVSKVFGNVKNPYIINQNHILKKKYFEVISG